MKKPIIKKLREMASALPTIFGPVVVYLTGREILKEQPGGLDGAGAPYVPNKKYKRTEIKPIDHEARLRDAFTKSGWAGVKNYLNSVERIFQEWETFAAVNVDFVEELRQAAGLDTLENIGFTKVALDALQAGGKANDTGKDPLDVIREMSERLADELAGKVIDEDTANGFAARLRDAGQDFARVEAEILGEMQRTGETADQVIEKRRRGRKDPLARKRSNLPQD